MSKKISPLELYFQVFNCQRDIKDFKIFPLAMYAVLTCSSSGATHTAYLQGSAVTMAVEAALTKNSIFRPTTLQEAACLKDTRGH